MCIKGFIFDLDMTLVDTSALFELRLKRNWKEVYSHIDQTKLYPGVHQLISAINDKYVAGIVTSSPRPYAEKVVRYHNINLDILVAYHDTSLHKPNPEPIMLGVKKLNIPPSQILSVGDELKDIIASKRAGTKTALITPNNAAFDQEIRPDYIFTSVSKLLDQINDILTRC